MFYSDGFEEGLAIISKVKPPYCSLALLRIEPSFDARLAGRTP